MQAIFPLKSGTALKLTTAKFLCPTGKSLQRVPGDGGVQPNEGFEVKLRDVEQQQLSKAMLLRSPITTNKEPIDFEDRQLEKALEHLREKLAG